MTMKEKQKRDSKQTRSAYIPKLLKHQAVSTELDQRYVNRWPLLDRRDSTEKLDAQEHREFRSEQRFDIAFGTKEIMREAAGPTTASKTKIEENRALPQRASVGKLDDVVHVSVDADLAGDPKTRCSTSGRVLAIGPCFTVRHRSVTQATVSLSSAESMAKAITKGCIEALYVKQLLEHQTARPVKIEVWTDSRFEAGC